MDLLSLWARVDYSAKLCLDKNMEIVYNLELRGTLLRPEGG